MFNTVWAALSECQTFVWQLCAFLVGVSQKQTRHEGGECACWRRNTGLNVTCFHASSFFFSFSVACSRLLCQQSLFQIWYVLVSFPLVLFSCLDFLFSFSGGGFMFSVDQFLGVAWIRTRSVVTLQKHAFECFRFSYSLPFSFKCCYLFTVLTFSQLQSKLIVCFYQS